MMILERYPRIEYKCEDSQCASSEGCFPIATFFRNNMFCISSGSNLMVSTTLDMTQDKGCMVFITDKQKLFFFSKVYSISRSPPYLFCCENSIESDHPSSDNRSSASDGGLNRLRLSIDLPGWILLQLDKLLHC